jgi:tetratricopeptide (TPR) repeat protein
MRSLRLFVCLAMILAFILFAGIPAQGAPAKPVTERQLYSWIAAEIPVFEVQSELQARGVNFVLDDAWRASLKKTGVSAQLLHALKNVSRSAPPAPPDEHAERLRRVIQEVKAGESLAASMHMAALVKENPSDPDLSLALGWTLGKQGEWGEAIPPLLDAVRLDPENGFAHELLSYASFKIGNSDIAVREGKAAVTLRPADPDAYKYLGLAYDVRREYEKSVAAYEHALKLKPDYAVVFYDEGVSFGSQGLLRESVDAYRKAIALDGNQWTYYHDLGNALADLRRWDEAIAAQKRAKGLAPDNVEIRQSLDSVYCSSGHDEEAVHESRELLVMDSRRNGARLCLYQSLMKLGRTEEAKPIKDELDKLEKDGAEKAALNPTLRPAAVQ